MKKIILAIALSLVIGQTAFAKEVHKTMEQSVSINFETSDYSELTDLLEKNVDGFSPETCFITWVNGNEDSATVNYSLYYMGCKTDYGIAVKIKNGTVEYYNSDLQKFTPPQKTPFCIDLLLIPSFNDIYVSSVQKYVVSNCYDVSGKENITALSTTYEKRLDEDNRVYIYFSTLFTNTADPMESVFREHYKYYPDEHISDVINYVKKLFLN